MIRLVFEKQWLHLLGLAVLLPAAAWFTRQPGVTDGAALGLDAGAWLWISIRLAVAHQVLVWFCWRMELHQKLLSTLMGAQGFTLYAVLFSILGIARTAAVWILAWANRGTLGGDPVWWQALAVAAFLPAAYLGYSVRRYFGYRRAFGADHFDPAYRDLPPVREGIFGWTPNGMYTYGFLILWVPALWWGSKAALIAAGFNHLYIWVHFLATERPDMIRIYGGRDETGS